MAEKIVERTVKQEPKETVVVHDDAKRSVSTGTIIAVTIVVILLLLILFGRG